jgi:ferredoxin
MVFYFSGTGNSLHVAEEIAKQQGERPVSIARELDRGTLIYSLKENESIGFIYPIYAWGPPRIVLDFIVKSRFDGKNPYVFSIATCGGSEGGATRLLQKALRSRGLALNSAFNLIMPSNYILGDDVSPKEEEEEILRGARARLGEIAAVVAKRQNGVFELIPGKGPFFLTALVNPLFNRFARSTKNFYATDACTSCGLCADICPVHTITVEDKPVWGRACTQCLGCINRCPAQAIQYGTRTLDRGRYVYPNESEQASQ